MTNSNSLNIGGTVGERITIALVLLGFVAEMLSDNWSQAPQAQPLHIEDCLDLCWAQGTLVERYESFACQCMESK